MKNKTCLAIDMGASSIRFTIGYLRNNILELEEIYRFENKPEYLDGHYRWNINKIMAGIDQGILAASKYVEIESIGVDSWGVDYALLDENNKLLEFPVSYRDNRTEGMFEKWSKYLSLKETFNLTGINYNSFNTLYQLIADYNSDKYSKVSKILFIAEFINFYLSGKAINELTISSTTQMLNWETQDWDKSIIEKIGIAGKLPGKPEKCGKILDRYIGNVVDQKPKIILTPAHDTAAALYALPKKSDNCAFISAGTWCVVGTFASKPFISDRAFEMGITNEIAPEGNFRPLKNTIGFWIVQQLKKVLTPTLAYDEIEMLAINEPETKTIIDINDPCFFNPQNMKTAIDEFIKSKYETKLNSPGEYYRCIYDSLSAGIAKVIGEFEKFNQNGFDVIHIIGGGSKSKLFCQSISNKTNLKVISGPVESTTIGNIISQMIALKYISNIDEGRKIISSSFSIDKFEPK